MDRRTYCIVHRWTSKYVTDNHGRLDNSANRHCEYPSLSQTDGSRTTKMKASQEEMKADMKTEIGALASRMDINQTKKDANQEVIKKDSVP
jgi:hypothetical protein